MILGYVTDMEVIAGRHRRLDMKLLLIHDIVSVRVIFLSRIKDVHSMQMLKNSDRQ